MPRCINDERASIPKVVINSRERPKREVEDGWREEGRAVYWNCIGLVVHPIWVCGVSIPQKVASPFPHKEYRIREMGRIADAVTIVLGYIYQISSRKPTGPSECG